MAARTSVKDLLLMQLRLASSSTVPWAPHPTFADVSHHAARLSRCVELNAVAVPLWSMKLPTIGSLV